MKIIEKSYRWRGTLEKRSTTSRIILHHAAAEHCTAEDIHAWHLANGWCGIGYHFFVRRDGSVCRGRAEDTVGAHAYGANADSLGICFEGDFQQDTMPDAQLQAGQKLVAYLKQKYGLSKVQAHRDVGTTDCPGRNFPFQEIAYGDGIEKETVEEEEKVMVSVRVLRRNHRGRDVMALQGALIAFGFSCGRCGADGIFGDDTAAAVKAFQKARGLATDGVCGKCTWAALLK